jgi:hypothetical protein
MNKLATIIGFLAIAIASVHLVYTFTVDERIFIITARHPARITMTWTTEGEKPQVRESVINYRQVVRGLKNTEHHKQKLEEMGYTEVKIEAVSP